MQYEVKELNLGGVLDYTIKLFKDNFLFLCGILGIIYLPPVFVFSFLMNASEAAAESAALAVRQGGAGPESMAAIGLIFLGLMLVSIPVMMVLALVSQGAVCHGIAERYMGRRITVGESISSTFRRVFPLLGLSIVSSLGIFAGLIFCVIPGVFVMLFWYIAIPVFMFERIPAMDCLGRSFRLMKGELGKAFVLVFLLAIINYATVFIAAIVPTVFLQSVVEAVTSALLMGLNAVAVTVFYFSARCKHESFDLELLTQSLGVEPAPDGPEL